MDFSKDIEPQDMMEMVRRIGQQFRYMRKEQKLSLDDLADRTGVSKLTLGKIERGETNPSLAVIWRIADGLSIPMSSLFETEKVIQLSRTGEGIYFTDGPWRVEPIFARSSNGNVDSYRAFLQPHSTYSSEYHPTSVMETATVMSGSVRIMVCDKPYELQLHDSIRFRGDYGHSYVNHSDSETILHISLERYV
ncbi:helix-turn-helix domain-containing protein [Paenibacillus sp. UNC451MF]|uniref:helix-turn-helix domain-containing protein n=1 Tax=Paenibacillus sp. UNC451MF TaxID=1449063 RepID=UPI00068ED2DC|nr:XRE family transcriptional regulator [Paenibacillus sp. UNC451MF]